MDGLSAGRQRSGDDRIAAEVGVGGCRTAKRNAEVGVVDERRVGIRVGVDGDGFDAEEARAGRRFDVILMNILAGPLIAMAPAAARRLAPSGACVLSGLLDRQASAVRAAYAAAGLGLRRRIELENWATLSMGRH